MLQCPALTVDAWSLLCRVEGCCIDIVNCFFKIKVTIPLARGVCNDNNSNPCSLAIASPVQLDDFRVVVDVKQLPVPFKQVSQHVQNMHNKSMPILVG